MRAVKTRNREKNIKILDKSVTLSMRMKDSFIRTKERAKEQGGGGREQQDGSSPTNYAIDIVQEKSEGAAEEAVRRFPNPRKKAAENMQRANGHFQKAVRQHPKGGGRTAGEGLKAAYKAECGAGGLRKTASQAQKATVEAKEAVRGAKQTLKQVRIEGRQAMRVVRQGIKLERRAAKTNPGRAIKGNLPRFGLPDVKGINIVRGRAISQNAKPASGAKPLKMPAVNMPKNVSSAYGAMGADTVRGTVAYRKANPATGAKPLNMRIGSIPESGSGIYGAKDADAVRGVPANPKANHALSTKPPDNPVSKNVNSNMTRPGYLAKSAPAPDNAAGAAKSTGKPARGVDTASKGFKDTAKGTVKTAGKNVKTAERSAKDALKTARQSAKSAQKTAQAAAKSAKAAEKAARASAKAAAKAAKAAAKAVAVMVKAAIAAIKGLVAVIAAGGWVAVLIILIISMIAMFAGSVFGIFFSREPDTGTGQTINGVIADIDNEYMAQIDGLRSSVAHDLLDMSGARAAWKQVLAVYTVRTVSDPDNPMEVATVNDEKAAILRVVFWDMNAVSYTLDMIDVEEDVFDGDGLPTGETVTITKTVLRITVSHKTVDEMAALYGFTDEQKEWLWELLKPEYHGMWNALLYGITSVGDGSMIEVAITQLGNIGGDPYWRWYGFPSRVPWCAIFASWVAEQCGFIEAGVYPMFSYCPTGEQLFKDRGQWRDGTYTPSPGDIIFFDWEPDGTTDHVGIVESISDGKVNTIEGNSSDSVRRRSYDIGSVKIYGYGVLAYTTH